VDWLTVALEYKMTKPDCSRLLSFLVAGALALSATTGAARGEDRNLQLFQSLTFVDAEGHVVRSDDFPGQWLLVYFGYTHCADFCPTGLSVMVNALDEIGPAAKQVQPIFITVDPENDKGVVLRNFTAAFDKRMVGLGGSVTQIKEAATALGVSFEKIRTGDYDYIVDHGLSYALIDLDRRRVQTFRIGEAHMLAQKLIDTLLKAGVSLDNVNNLRAFR
jgi:cytochrome oxidase Cu insertion factor (SCO1/SenC/PrrC family)